MLWRGWGIGGFVEGEGQVLVVGGASCFVCVELLNVLSHIRGHSRRSSLGHDGLRTTQLTLDLLTSPASSLNSSRLEFSVGLGLLDHSGEPVLSESINQFAIGVGVGQVTGNWLAHVRTLIVWTNVPDNSHGRAHKRLASVQIIGNQAKELEDMSNILLKSFG